MNTFSNTTFVFDSYDFDAEMGAIVLRYLIDGIACTERIVVPVDGATKPLPRQDLDRALFALHLMVGISYWKTLCSKTIEIKSGTLSRTQAHFWNTVYTNGLGEFYYRNDIDFRDQVHFPYGNDKAATVKGANRRTEHIMVPIGGGKDSIVTAEMLKVLNVPLTAFVVNGQASPIARSLQALKLPALTIQRDIDLDALDMIAKAHPDIFNGHVPISAVWSFLSVVVGLIHNMSDVVFSWERTANERNVDFLGMEVNHQWSKSLAFERSLQLYLDAFVTKRVRVWSLVRPLSEFAIVKRFASMPQFFDAFSSCNRNFTISNVTAGKEAFWCGECPKCTFIFNQLCAWLPHKDVVAIFGQDLYQQEVLLDLYRELLGIVGNKPFECVGTTEEVAAAFELTFRRGEVLTSPAMQLYVGEVRDGIADHDEVIERLLTPSDEHMIPKEILDRLDLAA